MRALCNTGRTLTRKQNIYLHQEHVIYLTGALRVAYLRRNPRSGKINVYNLTDRAMYAEQVRHVTQHSVSIQLALRQYIYNT